MSIGIYVLIVIVVLALIIVKKTIVIIPQSETKIIERLGRYYATLKPRYQYHHTFYRSCQGYRFPAQRTLFL